MAGKYIFRVGDRIREANYSWFKVGNIAPLTGEAKSCLLSKQGCNFVLNAVKLVLVKRNEDGLGLDMPSFLVLTIC